jgi:hypothetical protein
MPARMAGSSAAYPASCIDEPYAEHDLTSRLAADQFTDLSFAFASMGGSLHIGVYAFGFIFAYAILLALSALARRQGYWAALRALTFTDMPYRCAAFIMHLALQCTVPTPSQHTTCL